MRLRSWNRRSRLDCILTKAAFPVIMVLVLGLVTALKFVTGERFDFWFYGRHVDAALALAMIPAVAVISEKWSNCNILVKALALPFAAFLVLAATIQGPPWADFSQVHTVGAGGVMDWLYQAGDRWSLLVYCGLVFLITTFMCLANLRGRLRFLALAPFAVITTMTHITSEPFKGVPLNEAIPYSAATVLREARHCHIYWDARNGGRFRQHQYFRVQYYFPQCSIEIIPANSLAEPGGFVIARRSYASCQSEVECHDLHPDLVLYEIVK
ncbi:hypothetical protein DZC52_15060 [Wenzhouxiangella sediminis]|uniref:Uncharacterized protein n=1 Tax=Wenzhouxiangella sediminis TaxID=1792836 RepID=A0A3E1K4B4_9GAMM|nr:hypothetical protein DZC52_15060 [Wenzhouxiangella sediminis]